MVVRFNFFTAIIFLLLLIKQASAQNKPGISNNTSGLAEGIFVSNEQFLKQHPAFIPDQLYRTSGTSHLSIRSWSNKDSLYIIINKHKQSIPRDSVWGFYDDGNLFLQRNGYFHKVSLLGSISVFNEIYPLVKAPFTPVTTDATKEIVQSLVDLKSGKFYQYEVKSMLELLQPDEVLLNNFKMLNRKMRKKMMYSYIERFNDRHPLF